MTVQRSYSVFLAVSALHLTMVASMVYLPGSVKPPVLVPDMQGVLIAPQPLESVAQPRSEAPPRTSSRPPPPLPLPAQSRSAPVERSLPVPLPAPPSERAMSVPQAAAQPVPHAAPQAEVNPVAPRANPQPAAERSAQSAARPAPPSERQARPAGESSTAPLLPPRVEAGHLGNPKPSYPQISRRLGEQGQVLLEVLVLSDGTVGDLRVKTSSRHPRLDSAALDAVRHWRFQPARRGSTPIDYWYLLPIDFFLQ
jgi:periplasmic protein TonB